MISRRNYPRRFFFQRTSLFQPLSFSLILTLARYYAWDALMRMGRREENVKLPTYGRKNWRRSIVCTCRCGLEIGRAARTCNSCCINAETIRERVLNFGKTRAKSVLKVTIWHDQRADGCKTLFDQMNWFCLAHLFAQLVTRMSRTYIHIRYKLLDTVYFFFVRRNDRSSSPSCL